MSSDDFIPDSEFVPDTPPQKTPIAAAESSPDFIPDDQFVPDEKQANTLGENIGASAEALGHGLAGPIFTGAELLAAKAAGAAGFPKAEKALSPEAQEAREKALPAGAEFLAKSTGLGLGLFGPAGPLAKAGEAAYTALGLGKTAAELANIGVDASNATKVGRAVIQSMVEMGGLSAGDETTKLMLGKGDPETPWASAASNVGASALFGGGVGGLFSVAGIGAGEGLKAILNTQRAKALTQGIRDFGAQWKFENEHPNMVDAVHTELSNLYDNIKSTNVYGDKGIKLEAIEQLLPKEVNNGIVSHAEDINNLAKNVLKGTAEREESAFGNKFTKTMGRYNESINNAETPIDYYKAANSLKKEIDEYLPYEKIDRTDPRFDFVKDLQTMRSDIKSSLEDTKTWGPAGELQSKVNKLYTNYAKFEDAWEKRFTKEIYKGQREIDPTSIANFLKRSGKSGARSKAEEVPAQIMKNYVDAAEPMRDGINEVYQKLGQQGPFTETTLAATKNAYDDLSAWAKKARDLYNSNATHIASTLAGAAVAGKAGFEVAGAPGAISAANPGGHYLSKIIQPVIENVFSKNIKKSWMPAILDILGRNPAAVPEAVEHMGVIEKGQKLLKSGVDALFTGGVLNEKQKITNDLIESKNKGKIHDFIKDGGLFQQTQNTLQQPSASPSPGMPHFAEGGMVEKPDLPEPLPNKGVSQGHFSSAFPEQAMLMSASKGRVYNYLNNAKPQSNLPKLPFDKEQKDPEKERSYNNALNIANKPLSILQHIQKGTLEPEHVQHLVGMWPEVHNQLSKEITQKIVDGQVKGEKAPPAHIRQGLAMLMGVPLESNMTASSIQAAQSVFAIQKASTQSVAPDKTKKNTSKLGEMGKQHQTANQAAESRMQSNKS